MSGWWKETWLNERGNPDLDVIFPHCIIHRNEFPCRSVLQLNRIVKPAVKFLNFIRANGLQHCQFITFLEETDADLHDVITVAFLWLSLGKVFQRARDRKEEIGAFLELMGKSDAFPQPSNQQELVVVLGVC